MPRLNLFWRIVVLTTILVTVIYLFFIDLLLVSRQVETYDFHGTADEIRCFNSPTPSSDAIPKIVHVIWLNNSNLTFMNYLTIRSALLSLKPDQLNLHYTCLNEENEWFQKLRDNVTLVHHDLDQEYAQQIKDKWDISHVADVLRLDVIGREGGIYLDMDVIALRPFDNLLHSEKDVILGHEGGDRNGLCNAIILSRKGASFIRRWIESYSTFSRSEWNYHSVILPKKLSRQHPDEICALSPDVFFWPTWTTGHIRYMHEPISKLQAREVQRGIDGNGGGLYPHQLAYHAWSHAASSYLDSLTPEAVKEQDTRFNVMVRRFLD